MNNAEHPAFPAQIGRYELVAELGRGGTGIVYQAYEPLLERTVALKILAPGLIHEPGTLERLHREAIQAARLRHLNIALLYEFAQIDGIGFLAMEYIPGQTLRAALSAGSAGAPALSAQRALTILGQISQALDYMHRVGVVHRDVKPGNVIIGPGDHTVLIDFGLAHAAEASLATTSGALLGTPTYMSPEQAAGRPVNARSDQYAMATVAYEMLTGTAPFAGRPPVAMVHAHLYEQPVPPSERCPGLPVAVDAVLLRALAKTPADRYPSLQQFVDELRMAFARPLLGRVPGGPSGRWRHPKATRRPGDAGGRWTGWASTGGFAVRRQRRLAALLAASLAALLLLRQSAGSATLGARSWAQTRAADPAPGPAAGVPLPEHIAWSYDPGLVGGPPLALADDTLVVANLDGTLAALQASTGALKWQLPGNSLYGAPSLGGRLVFVGTSYGEVMALSAQSGGLVWRTEVVGDVQLAPTVEQDYLVVTTTKGYVYLLRSANGEVIWSRPLAEGAQAAVVRSGRALVSADNTLFSLDLHHGAIDWKFAAASRISTDPIIIGDLVLAGTERGKLYGVSLADGRERWRYQARGALSAAPASDGANFFVVDRAGGITALSPATGAELWHRDVGAAINATPLLADGTLFLGTSNGSLYAFAAADGAQLVRMQLAGSIDTAPAAGDGLLYVRADRIYALGSSPK